jgi:hypothetical protein
MSVRNVCVNLQTCSASKPNRPSHLNNTRRGSLKIYGRAQPLLRFMTTRFRVCSTQRN